MKGSQISLGLTLLHISLVQLEEHCKISHLNRLYLIFLQIPFLLSCLSETDWHILKFKVVNVKVNVVRVCELTECWVDPSPTFTCTDSRLLLCSDSQKYKLKRELKNHKNHVGEVTAMLYHALIQRVRCGVSGNSSMHSQMHWNVVSTVNTSGTVLSSLLLSDIVISHLLICQTAIAACHHKVAASNHRAQLLSCSVCPVCVHVCAGTERTCLCKSVILFLVCFCRLITLDDAVCF